MDKKIKLDEVLIGKKMEPRYMEYNWRDIILYALAVGAHREDVAYTYEKAGRGLETSGRRDRRGTLQYWKRLSGTYGKMSCRRTAGICWDMGSLETAGDRIFDDLDRFSGKTDHAPGEKECFCR